MFDWIVFEVFVKGEDSLFMLPQCLWKFEDVLGYHQTLVRARFKFSEFA